MCGLSQAWAGLVQTPGYPLCYRDGNNCSRRPNSFRTLCIGDSNIFHPRNPWGTPVGFGVCGGHSHCDPSVVNQDLLLFSLRSEGEEAPPTEEPAPGQDATQHCLWVDEFAPQHYTELLSDDVSSYSHSSVTGLPYQQEERARV